MLDRFFKKEKPFSGIQGFGGGIRSTRRLEPTTDEQSYIYTGNSVVSASRPGPSVGKDMQSVRFYVQGAGGGVGSSQAPNFNGNVRQSGGFTDYTHTSNLQDTYKLVIGQAGIPLSGGSAWGGGSDGGNMTGRGQIGGGGGGGSFVFYEPVTSFTSTNPYHSSIVVCSGGGGGAFFSNPSTYVGVGGKGGTTVGQSGQRTTSTGNGSGGTQSGGGSGGPNYPSGTSADPGSNHRGGNSSQSGYEYGGGGGGGGYYGGGGGGSCISVCPGPTGNGAGGGGSSYYRAPEGTLNSWTQGYDSTSPKFDSSRGGANQPGKITIVWEWLE